MSIEFGRRKERGPALPPTASARDELGIIEHLSTDSSEFLKIDLPAICPGRANKVTYLKLLCASMIAFDNGMTTETFDY